MKKPSFTKDIPINVKIFIVAAFIIAVAALDYRLFLSESENIEIYDGMHSELSSVRVSVAKLEYTLDMFLAAKRLDNTTLTLLRRDVEQLDRAMNEVLLGPVFSPIVKGNLQISENMEAISNDWQIIKTEVMRLKETVSPEELMLIHNAVDVKTVMMNEMNDRVMGVISQRRSDILDDINTLALATSAGFALVGIAIAVFFYRRAYYPAIAASRAAEEILSGNGSKRFNETEGGFMGTLAFKLNLVLAAARERIIVMEEKTGGMAEELKRRTVRLEAVNAMNASIARSLSLADVFSIAVKEAVQSGGADGAAVFLAEDGLLKLKASSGLGGIFLNEGSGLPIDAFAGMQEDMSTRIFSNVEEYPYEIMRPLFKGAGCSCLISVPVKRDMKTAGYFYAMFKGAPPDSGAPFFEAAAQGIEGYIGYASVYYAERNLRRFFERALEQMPMGVAVFDRQGACTFANSRLKKLLNAHPEFVFAGAYSVMEDDAFSGDAVKGHIRNVYAGYTAEFMVEYAPSITARFGFGTSLKRFKIKGSPLYDLGGEISSIMLLYEPVVDEAAGSGAVTGLNPFKGPA
ncbi:MAG: hypothetical protein HZB82_06045 [Deltaproteobacteria bacterium]|nr:hypothetical protein [Deltaproteobacteria bacterium]